jgi:hypothetical protein
MEMREGQNQRAQTKTEGQPELSPVAERLGSLMQGKTGGVNEFFGGKAEPKD